MSETPVDEIDSTFSFDTHKETYTMPGSCSNCGRKYRVKITKGHSKPSWSFPLDCPHCGCRAVSC
jgi:rRNA maturation protein Nop10